MNPLLSSRPISIDYGIAIVRIVFGLLLIYHGYEIFHAETMNSYLTWDPFKNNFGKIMVYAGKGAEFVAGILLLLGLATRLASIIVILTFVFITFFIGNGKFWYQDQHPFMFLLFGVLFLLTGAGAWSLKK